MGPTPPQHGTPRLLTLTKAAKIWGVTVATACNYASGKTPIEFDFKVQSVPVTIHRTARGKNNPPPRNPRQSRRVIPEPYVHAFKEVLDAAPRRRTKNGPLSRKQLSAMESAARRALSLIHS